MGELVSQAGRKALAVGVLVLAAYLLFKLAVGFVTSIVWIGVVIVAVIAIVWAVRTL
jgi:hypothetical protein